MVVMHKKTVRLYAERNAQAAEALNLWYQMVTAADWSNFNELTASMPATDYIAEDYYVFNVKGNHYRVIALIFFDVRTVLIKGIFTHAEYSKLSKAKILSL